jgi:hypothetical protein
LQMDYIECMELRDSVGQVWRLHCCPPSCSMIDRNLVNEEADPCTILPRLIFVKK